MQKNLKMEENSVEGTSVSDKKGPEKNISQMEEESHVSGNGHSIVNNQNSETSSENTKYETKDHVGDFKSKKEDSSYIEMKTDDLKEFGDTARPEETLRNIPIRTDNRKVSSDKHVRFAEKDKDDVEVKTGFVGSDFSLQSAESKETKVVWETISDSQKELIDWSKNSFSESTDSVFDDRRYDGEGDPWEKVTDLDEDENLNYVLKDKSTFKKYLDDRSVSEIMWKDEKMSVSEFLSHLYDSEEGGGGAAPAPAPSATHTCGSLFAQCGAHRQDSLVTTFSHGRYKDTYRHADDTYTGPVSLTEILAERQGSERMCRLREIDDELDRLEHSLMGHGASTNNKERNGHGLCSTNPFVDCNKGVEVPASLRQWEEKTAELGEEVTTLRREVKRKDHEILRLQREVHKLKSVLQQAANFRPDSDLLSSLHGHGLSQSSGTAHKKQGVSAESSQPSQTATDIQIQRYDKDFRSKQMIKEAIMDNDFLKNLDLSQVRELVESMYPKEFTKGSYLIREGEVGAHLYVSAEGEFEVIKENKVLGRMGPGKAFGELAILYNCTRTASIRVVKDSKVWVLDRRVFQRIMMRTGLQRLEDNVNFLRSVPLLHNLSSEVLGKISDVLEVEFYPTGHHIVRQGASGDTFFILSQGSVKVTQRQPVYQECITQLRVDTFRRMYVNGYNGMQRGSPEDQDLRVLHRGDYFGEQALLKEDCRTATVSALAPGVECLTLDRESFIQLIGDLSELHEKEYSDLSRTERAPSRSNSVPSEVDQDLQNVQLEDLDIVATLGVGGFGRVELVQCLHEKSKTYALKCLKKQHIVETHQQEHVYSEKEIMMSCRHPFICRLYKTFKDSKYVYMMLEACLGGEVWTILRDRGCFDDLSACFITACVIEALDYLHSKNIVYRDLKPENLLLDSRGYVKLVDFGFAKRLGLNSSKTWTFCGTPEYVAPEIILNKGHDRAVDCWALGILMHELLTGAPPFSGSDPMKIYNMILKGIDMVDFPRHVTRTAQALIKKLCRDMPAERLGCQKGGLADIKKNRWFQGFDWDGLRHQTMVPPIVPQVRSPVDTSNFDHYAKDPQVPYDEDSNWDADF